MQLAHAIGAKAQAFLRKAMRAKEANERDLTLGALRVFLSYRLGLHGSALDVCPSPHCQEGACARKSQQERAQSAKGILESGDSCLSFREIDRLTRRSRLRELGIRHNMSCNSVLCKVTGRDGKRYARQCSCPFVVGKRNRRKEGARGDNMILQVQWHSRKRKKPDQGATNGMRDSSCT